MATTGITIISAADSELILDMFEKTHDLEKVCEKFNYYNIRAVCKLISDNTSTRSKRRTIKRTIITDDKNMSLYDRVAKRNADMADQTLKQNIDTDPKPAYIDPVKPKSVEIKPEYVEVKYEDTNTGKVSIDKYKLAYCILVKEYTVDQILDEFDVKDPMDLAYIIRDIYKDFKDDGDNIANKSIIKFMLTSLITIP